MTAYFYFREESVLHFDLTPSASFEVNPKTSTMRFGHRSLNDHCTYALYLSLPFFIIYYAESFDRI